MYFKIEFRVMQFYGVKGKSKFNIKSQFEMVNKKKNQLRDKLLQNDRNNGNCYKLTGDKK